PVRAWWNVPWLTDRRLWAESLASALWLLAAGTVWWLADRLSVAQQVLAVGVLLAVLAWLLRGGWVRLFGPVLFYDLVRLARRNRYFIIRCAYAVGLLLMLYWVHEQFAAQMRLNAMLYRGTIGMTPWMATNPPGREMAEFAEWFFYTVMVVQFAAV